MPLVLLEGPDGAGKTTLAKRLLKGTGKPTLLVSRSGPPTDDDTLEAQSRWIWSQGHSHLNIIADRHPIISEAIYRPIVRKQGNAPWSLREVCDALRDRDQELRIIYCRPSFEVLQGTKHAEKQMEGVHENFRELVAEYDRWFAELNKTGVKIYVHNFRDDLDCRRAVSWVRDFWEHPHD